MMKRWALSWSILMLVCFGAGAGAELRLERGGEGSPGLVLQWRGAPGGEYDLERSDNLAAWQSMEGFPRAATGAVEEVPVSTESERAFFRLVHLAAGPPQIHSEDRTVVDLGAEHAAALTIAAPANLTEGDLLVIFVGSEHRNGQPIDAPEGLTLLRQDGAGDFNPRTSIYYKLAGAAEPESYTFTAGLPMMYWAVAVRVTGFEPSAPFDGPGAGASSGGNAVSSLALPSMEATGDKRLLLAAWFWRSTSGEVQVDPDMGEQWNLDEIRAAGAAQQISQGPSGPRTATYSGSSRAAGSMVAVSPAGAEPPPLPLWSETVNLAEGHGALSVGPDGLLHFAGEIDGNCVYRRSEDDGATWSAPSPVPGAVRPARRYGALAVDETGVIHLLSQDGAGNAQTGNLLYHRSTDNGATWSTGVRISEDSPTGDGDRPVRTHIVATDGVVHIVNGRGAGAWWPNQNDVWYWRNPTNGADPGAWTRTLLLEAAPGESYHLPHIAADGQSVHLVVGRQPDTTKSYGTDEHTWHISSSDAGLTWSSPVMISDGLSDYARRPRVKAVDDAVIATFDVQNGAAEETYITRSTDGGGTWSDPVPTTAQYPRRANHSDSGVWTGGRVHIVAGSDDATQTPRQHLIHTWSEDYGQTWSEDEIAMQESFVLTHLQTRVSAGHVHIVADIPGQPGVLYSRRGVP